MLKFLILLVLGLIVTGNCRSSETRKRLRIDGNGDEHVHIKVVLKPKLPSRHSTRPQNVATLRQSAAASQSIQDQHFELPAPMPIFTTQHDILAHIAGAAAASAADNNDVGRHNHSTRTQPKHKKQQQRKQHKRAPVMMKPPPPPAPLSSPFMATPDIFSSTVLDGNVLTADDFLREVQHLYAQNYGGANSGGGRATPTLIMQPQMQALTKTTTTTTSTTTTRPTSTKMAKNNDKKRKHNQSDYNYNYNHFPYGKQTYLQQQQLLQQSQQQSQLQQGFKPYMSNQAHGNYYYYDDYNRNNHHFFDINNNNSNNKKKSKLNIMENLAMGANQLGTHQIADDIDANSSINSDGSSTEDYSSDSGSDTVMAFNAPIHPEEPSVATIYESPLSPSYNNNNNNNYYNSQLSSNGKTVGDNNDDGIDNDDDDDDDDDDESFNPISYQDLYATYSATPAAQHFSTMPTMTTTGLKYKRHNQHYHQQQQQYRQQKGQPLREQFVQLSSIAPAAASSGINAFRIAPASSLTSPTTSASTTTTMNSGGFNIYGDAQQPLEARYRKRKNRIKVKRNSLMVH